jgi:selenocysteine lyase/cysteine desulfurase
VELLTPAGSGTSMVSFRTARLAYDRLFERLWKNHKLRCRPVSEQNLNAIRVSTHLFNSPAECDTLIAAVGEVLRAT